MTSGQLRIKVTSQRYVLAHHGSHNVGFKVSPVVTLPAAQESGESFRELHVLQHLPLDFGHKLARRFANREPARWSNRDNGLDEDPRYPGTRRHQYPFARDYPG